MQTLVGYFWKGEELSNKQEHQRMDIVEFELRQEAVELLQIFLNKQKLLYHHDWSLHEFRLFGCCNILLVMTCVLTINANVRTY